MRYTASHFPHWLIGAAGLLLLLLSGQPASAQESEPPAVDSAAAPEVLPRYEVHVERLSVANMRLDDTLDVILDAHGNDIAGYVLKVGADNGTVAILEVLPGELIDSCGWEFFRAVEANTMTNPDLPTSLWQITGLYKMAPDSTAPPCLGLDRPVSLARLVVSSAHRREIPDTTVPIFFFWQACRDNVLSDATGERLQVSRRVLDYFSAVYREADSTAANAFPNRTGTPRQCIKPNVRNAPMRTVDFYNGGVEFKLKLGDSPDTGAVAD